VRKPRQRATALVVRDGGVLLVRDRGKHHFSLPGAGIRRGETTIGAAARELYEELGPRATIVRRHRECDFKGAVTEHRVCLVKTSGVPHLESHELDRFLWWNTEEAFPSVPVQSTSLIESKVK